ncbi:hypothetical protein BL253_18820 [Pseudofrankia asymbiotica]|uniref:Uncharacterized protein n=1 Tax=Pseudofrankia asymbiotica TaxID=1834516 RepID=A0A1V2I8L8_9ACTN|nr:hypothetical protein BL253_18820 [Pseudofrankia asymbiotica]
MYHAGGVNRRQRRRDGHREPFQVRDRHGTPLPDRGGQIGAVDELGHQVGAPAVHADVEHLGGAEPRDPLRRVRLAQESCAELGLPREVAADHLQSDAPVATV